MIVLTTAEICEKYRISPAELARATRELNAQTGEIYYRVTSRTNGPDHIVRSGAHKSRRLLTCTCAAGQVGTPCWAQRAACARAFLYRQEENIQARAEADAAAHAKLVQARDNARALVAGLNPGKGVCQARPFSLLK